MDERYLTRREHEAFEAERQREREANAALHAEHTDRINRDHEPRITSNSVRHDSRDKADELKWWNPHGWWDNASEETAGRAIKVFRQLAILFAAGFVIYAIWAFVTDPAEREHEREMQRQEARWQRTRDSLELVREIEAARAPVNIRVEEGRLDTEDVQVDELEIDADEATVRGNTIRDERPQPRP